MQPQDLLEFDRVYAVSGKPVTLAKVAGPVIDLRWGTVALTDPWFPEMLPEFQVLGIRNGVAPTVLSTVDVLRGERRVSVACAAAIGPVDEVASWQPLVQDEAHFHLDCDSGLGAFYDITDAAVLRPFFEDDLYMKGVYDRALEQQIVTMEIDGRVVAVVFLCPAGPGLYPAYAGFNKDMVAAAVLVDLTMLDDDEESLASGS